MAVKLSARYVWRMDEDGLSQEQEFLLARVALEASELSREELITEVVACWYSKYLMQNMYDAVLDENNIGFRLVEQQPPDLSEPGALAELMGHEPTLDEATDFVLEYYEGATMELDMDEIVLTTDD